VLNVGLTIALIGHAGNSVFVRGGLEVFVDAMADALSMHGVTAIRRLDQVGPSPDLSVFVGAYYGLAGAFEAAAGLPRVVIPLLLHPGSRPSGWRQMLDRGRSRLSGSLLYTRRRMLSDADLVIVHSESEAQDARSFGARRVEVIPAGIAAAHFDTRPPGADELDLAWQKRAQRWALREVRVVSVGRFERRKNQIETAAACERLGYPLLLIGRRSPTETAYFETLQNLAGPLVEVWEDPPSEVVRWALSASDVHVLASRHETTGLVSLEAAAAGCRPVALDYPVSREYIGGFGEFAPDAAPVRVADAIEAARRRGRLSERELRLVGTYSWSVIADRLVTAFRSVLPQRTDESRVRVP
jgi:glycosyltransferase involved in cell wall biosynthesis